MPELRPDARGVLTEVDPDTGEVTLMYERPGRITPLAVDPPFVADEVIEGNVSSEPPEMVRCSYGATCLRRNRDGMVPAIGSDGRRTYSHCGYCDLDFCQQHNHVRRTTPAFRCGVCNERQPVCRQPELCDGCQVLMCPDCQHEQGGQACSDQQEMRAEGVIEDVPGRGYYSGPYREAELLFNGDTPVPGLAEGKRYASIELEEEIRSGGTGRLRLPQRFGITTDGSLSNGIEVTLPPSRMDALVDNVRTATSALLAGGYHATASCGLHAGHSREGEGIRRHLRASRGAGPDP